MVQFMLRSVHMNATYMWWKHKINVCGCLQVTLYEKMLYLPSSNFCGVERGGICIGVCVCARMCVCVCVCVTGMPIFRYFLFFSVIFGLIRSPPIRFSVSVILYFFSYFIFLFLNFLSLFVFIFCETARTRRFSVILAKVQWHPWCVCVCVCVCVCARARAHVGVWVAITDVLFLLQNVTADWFNKYLIVFMKSMMLLTIAKWGIVLSSPIWLVDFEILILQVSLETRIKEEPSADIQFPVLDENDEVTEAEQLLQLEGNFEGFRPEWCISAIYHAWVTPFWSGTLNSVLFLSFGAYYHSSDNGIEKYKLWSYNWCCMPESDFNMTTFVWLDQRTGETHTA